MPGKENLTMAMLLKLLKPPIFADEDKTQKARILNVVLLTTIALICALIATYILSSAETTFSSAPLVLGGLVIIMVGLTFVMRKGHLRLASFLFVSSGWAVITFLAWNANGLRDSAFIGSIVIILMASLLLGWRESIFFTTLSLAAGWVFVYLEKIGQMTPAIEDPQLLAVELTVIYILIAVLIYLIIDSLSKAVQAVRQSNQELQEFSDELELRVAEGIQTLQLAAQVGHSVSQFHDLNKLLDEAVDIIHERFALYHTQIYLVDQRKHNLVLRAGSGSVGAELLRRKHTLPINNNSINGTAVLQQTAIIVLDTATSKNFKPNPLLPKTRAEIAVPLIVGEWVLGVLNLQSNVNDQLTEESLTAYDVVASQLAIAIQNARLITETAAAHQEAELTLQQLTKQGWREYLNAIDRQQYMGFSFDADELHTLKRSQVDFGAKGADLQLPIAIANESVGEIRLTAQDGQTWDQDTVAMVTAVSKQVAQQIEAIRLIDETNRYRTQAETAVRRLSQDVWRDYANSQDVTSDGFVYDRNQVMPLTSDSTNLENSSNAKTWRHPLQINNAHIGDLEIDGVTDDPEHESMVAAVAEQLSSHIENLRLAKQTEQALADTQRRSEELSVINEVARTVAAQLETKKLLEEVLTQIKRILPTDSYTVALYDRTAHTMRFLIVYDNMEGYRYDLPPTLVEPHHISHLVIANKAPELVLFTPEQIAEHHKNRPANLIDDTSSITASLLFVPLMHGEEIMGILSIQSYQINAYTQTDVNLVSGLASYVATALQNIQLFQEIQRRGEKERIINMVAQKIQSKVTMEDALQTAVTELGTALKAQYTQIELSSTEKGAVNGSS
jgi:GAF domain-containing protein